MRVMCLSVCDGLDQSPWPVLPESLFSDSAPGLVNRFKVSPVLLCVRACVLQCFVCEHE